MPEDDDLQRRLRKLEVGHAETRWRTLRVDDDVKEIREELRAVRATQQEHSNRFDSIDAQLQEHGRLLQEHGNRFDGIDARLQEHGNRFDAIDAHLQEHGNRFDSIGAQLRSLTQLVGQVLERLPGHDK